MRAKTRKPDEVDRPFETLLRKFMACKMGIKQGNERIRALIARSEKKAIMWGLAQGWAHKYQTYKIGMRPETEVYRAYRKETRRK